MQKIKTEVSLLSWLNVKIIEGWIQNHWTTKNDNKIRNIIRIFEKYRNAKNIWASSNFFFILIKRNSCSCKCIDHNQRFNLIMFLIFFHRYVKIFLFAKRKISYDDHLYFHYINSLSRYQEGVIYNILARKMFRFVFIIYLACCNTKG